MNAQRADRRGDDARRAIAIALSAALHAAVLVALAAQREPAPTAPRAPALLARLVLAPGRLVITPDGGGPMAPHPPSAADRALPAGCRGDTYTGIGVRINQAGYIIDLAADGPAEHAGLRPGDAILNVDDVPIDLYPVGHAVTLRLLRDGRQALAVVRIGAICNDPPTVAV